MDTSDGVIANPEVLISGSDFYSSPRLSPDGSRLCWLSWNHPNMPWDGTELWVGALNGDGKVGERRLVAGGIDESICQPEWSPDGRLYFVSDRSGWWNLYRWDSRTDQSSLRVHPAHGGGVRPAAVDIRSKLLRIRLGRPGHMRRQPQWGLGIVGCRFGERALDGVGRRRLLGNGPVRPANWRRPSTL